MVPKPNVGTLSGEKSHYLQKVSIVSFQQYLYVEIFSFLDVWFNNHSKWLRLTENPILVVGI